MLGLVVVAVYIFFFLLRLFGGDDDDDEWFGALLDPSIGSRIYEFLREKMFLLTCFLFVIIRLHIHLIALRCFFHSFLSLVKKKDGTKWNLIHR